MIPVRGYAAHSAKRPLGPYAFKRRDPRPRDIVIDILYCGICHSDIHQVKNEWDPSDFPVVPGHEIVGRVIQTGARVKTFKVGDVAGVGCYVDSCRTCAYCKKGLEQFCSVHTAFTYAGTEMDLKTPTQGGYSSQIVVDENYALHIAPQEPLERVAPLLCAGITTYSPLRHWKVGKGRRVGIVGLGGLGHMAVKLAASLGAEVTVFSTTPSKARDARRLGADHFVLSNKKSALSKLTRTLDFIIDTVSAPHPVSSFIELLRPDGTLALVGASPKPLEVEAFSVVMGRRSLAGSLIGGMAETQEMLDYCARKKVYSDVEVIPVSKINDAYRRVIKGDVRYRFVIDLKTL